MGLFDIFKKKKPQLRTISSTFVEKATYTEDELFELFHAACDSFNSTNPDERKFFEKARGSEALRLAWLDEKRRKKEAYDQGIRISFKKTYLNFMNVLEEDYSKKT